MQLCAQLQWLAHPLGQATISALEKPQLVKAIHVPQLVLMKTGTFAQIKQIVKVITFIGGKMPVEQFRNHSYGTEKIWLLILNLKLGQMVFQPIGALTLQLT